MLIGEIAKITGLSKDGIRHYEQMGLIRSVPRQAGSKTYRDYDPSVLDAIEQIRGAQHFLRLSLKEIGPLLKAIADSPPTKEQTVKYLEERVAVIRDQMTSLREVEDFLCKKIERYRNEIATASRSTEGAPGPKVRSGEAVRRAPAA